MSRLRQIPWLPLVLTLLVVVGGGFPSDPIRDAISGGVVTDARLERSFGYVVLGPISSMFDALTLLTVAQIIGFTVWVIGLYVAARACRPDEERTGPLHEAIRGAVALGGLLIVYAAAVILPRPMAQLIIGRTDAIAVDFHSHTHYSHDGRPGWSASDVRDWHAAAGYNVAYVTDHATFDGVRDALALDSTVAGQGTTLLPGIEAFYHGEHVNILNAGTRYRGLTTADYRDVDDAALAVTSEIRGLEPVLVETMPGNLSAIIAAHGPGTAGIRAIEIVDGSPRGLAQTKRDHDRIVHLADSLQLALVAGSDNHGWGRVAPGWTMLRVPEWRAYAPEELAVEIDKILRLGGRGATHVVERTTASARPVAVLFTLPVVAWTVSRTLSYGERIAWVFWIWIPWSIVFLARRRHPAPAR